MKVTSARLPGKWKRAIAHAAAMPKAVFIGTASTATVIVSSTADVVSGVGQRGEVRAPALLERLREHRRQRHDQEAAEEQQRGAGEQQPHPQRIVDGGARAHTVACSGALPRRRAHACRTLIARSRANDTTSITLAIAVAPA